MITKNGWCHVLRCADHAKQSLRCPSTRVEFLSVHGAWPPAGHDRRGAHLARRIVVRNGDDRSRVPRVFHTWGRFGKSPISADGPLQRLGRPCWLLAGHSRAHRLLERRLRILAGVGDKKAMVCLYFRRQQYPRFLSRRGAWMGGMGCASHSGQGQCQTRKTQGSSQEEQRAMPAVENARPRGGK